MASEDTRMQALRDWFGSSQLLDRNGEPLVLYHGATGDFKSFRPSLSHGEWGAGSYFTTSKELANQQAASPEGGNVMPVYVKIENPVPAKVLQGVLAKYRKDGGDWDPQDVSDEIEGMGYDGVILQQGEQITAIAYDPTQIKSALGNHGVYDGMSPDIRFSLAEQPFTPSTPDAVRAAIAQLVRVSADELSEGVGTILVTTTEDVKAGAMGGNSEKTLDSADQAKGMSNRAASHVFRAMVDSHRDALESVLFNWKGCELGRDEESIVWIPSRDPHRPQAYGRAPGIKAFIAWVVSDGPFDKAQYGSDIGSNQEWLRDVESLRSTVPVRHSLAAGAAGRDPRAQAFHDAATNTTVFLADRIAAGQEAAVFLHETVHRHGRQALPEGRWDALVGQVKAWAQAEPRSPERAIHDAAAARVATAGVAGALADEELFAYAVEEAVARGIEPSAAAVEGSAQAWLQAVVESIQRISDKLLGNDLHELGGQDLVDLAYALAQLDSPEHGAEVRRALRDQPEVAPQSLQKGRDRDLGDGPTP